MTRTALLLVLLALVLLAGTKHREVVRIYADKPATSFTLEYAPVIDYPGRIPVCLSVYRNGLLQTPYEDWGFVPPRTVIALPAMGLAKGDVLQFMYEY